MKQSKKRKNTNKIDDLASNGGRVSTRHHLLDDGSGTDLIIGTQESTRHGLVCARLALLHADAVVDGLGLGDVALSGPAVDESVGNVSRHLDLALSHVR